MIPKFIYVSCPEDKEKLLEAGFALIKEDTGKSLYVFMMDATLKFNVLDEVNAVLSNVITF